VPRRASWTWRDGQRSIQLFSADGTYNNTGQALSYPPLAPDSAEGYDADPGDLAYEPPRQRFGDFDPGPSQEMARLLQGGEADFPWPDFAALGLGAHPSFGFGPIYRGRLVDPSLLILVDQSSHDDLLLGRALTGEAGQRMQGLLRAAGIERRYAVLRTLPVDSAAAPAAVALAAADDPRVRSLLAEAARRARPNVVLALGPGAARVVSDVAPAGTPTIAMKAWNATGALADWRRALEELATLSFPKDSAATFAWNGERIQVPRIDLPFGTLRWQGTSGDRSLQPRRSGVPSADYYKTVMPAWAAALGPDDLTPSEQRSLDELKG
jgi:hypothetical protein